MDAYYDDFEDVFDEIDFDADFARTFSGIGEEGSVSVKVLDMERYAMMLVISAGLHHLCGISEEDIEVDVDEVFGLGSVSAEVDELTVDSAPAFAELLLLADNFEVYPLTNGKLRLSFALQQVLKKL